MRTPRGLLSVWFLLGPALSAADSTGWIAALGGKVTIERNGNVGAIDLRGSWVNDTQLIQLARMLALERLDLSHTRITDEGMLYLRPVRTIADLNLFYAEQITDQGMAAIRDWKQLKRLNVRGTRISDGTLEIVSHLTQLEALDIANTGVTDNGLDYLITLTKLRELSLGRRRQSDNVVELLRLLPTLTYLDLSGPSSADRPDTVYRTASDLGTMREDLVRAIRELKDLRILKLGHSNISADGLRMLSGLDKVEKLGLEVCARIDDTSVTTLAGWKSLKYLDLQETRITDKGIESLRKARPGLAVLASPAESTQPSR